MTLRLVASLALAAALGAACRSSTHRPPRAAPSPPGSEPAAAREPGPTPGAATTASLPPTSGPAAGDPNARDENGATPLVRAVAAEDLAAVRDLLDRGARVDDADASGQTPLTAAVVRRDAEALRLLLDRGARVNPPGVPITPLMLACGSGGDDQLPLVDLLLEAGAEVDAHDHSGRTPLMYAAGRIRRATVERLVAAGADVSARDGEGHTVLFYLGGPGERALRDPIVAFLREHGALD